MRKQDIKTGAVEYATHVTNSIPQRSLDGKIMYYFSGSLAMLLLPSTKNIAFVGTDSNGGIDFISPQSKLSKETRACFDKGVRPMSLDVDVVEIDETTFMHQGKHYTLSKIMDVCKFATDLCPGWKNMSGAGYFDVLSYDRAIGNHNIASLELDNGAKIYTANPVDMMLHKLAETLFVQTRPKLAHKYEKDLKDLSCFLNGLISLEVIPDDFQAYLNTVVENNPDSAISGLTYSNLEKELKQLAKDIKPYIDAEKLPIVNSIIESTSAYNQSKIQTQPQ